MTPCIFAGLILCILAGFIVVVPCLLSSRISREEEDNENEH